MNKHFLRQRRFRGAALLVAAGWLSLSAQAEIYFVDAGAQGSDDGSSWSDAYTDLQDALAAIAAGDEIRVAAGVYKPVTPVDPNDVSETERLVSFELQDEVAVYGGFPPGGGDWEDRDWQVHVTVLSGDIDDNDTADTNGVVTDASDIAGANSGQVLTGENIGPDSLLDGFFITAGQASGTPGFPVQGGGMYLNLPDLVLNNIVFSGNHALHLGGGVSINNAGSPVFTNVRFQGNRSSNNCGGMHVGSGSLELTNAAFVGNRASGIGAGMCKTAAGPYTLTNVVFHGNQAETFGGGLFNNKGAPNLFNVSFSGNDADQGGGMSIWNGIAIVRNSIFWNNQAGDVPNTAWESILNGPGGTTQIGNSLVQHCNPGGNWSSVCGTNSGNNLEDADPLFADTPDPQNAPSTAGDLRLTAGSPAIDAGNDIFVDGIDFDLDGNDRIFGSAVDLGPYETFAELTLSTALLDFGQVEIGQTGGPLDIVISNAGALDLEVTSLAGLADPFSLDAGGDCGGLPITVPAGDACVLSFTFSPEDQLPAAQIVTLQSDSAGGDMELALQGQGFVIDDVFADRFEQ